MLSSRDKHVGVHMFVDDYKFERLWNQPERYINSLKQFDCVFTPDFSLYMDMPIAMKIWNTDRSRLLGQNWQKKGSKVITIVSWAELQTFEFCFDGIEEESIVAISTVGVKQDPFAIEVWKDGVTAMIEKIHPYAILIYGERIKFDFHGLPVFWHDPDTIKRLRKIEVKESWVDVVQVVEEVLKVKLMELSTVLYFNQEILNLLGKMITHL